jgi:SAM-dependent methyltransferase
MWSGESIGKAGRPDPEEEVVVDHAAGHVAVDHEYQATEHPPLAHVLARGEDRADAFAQGLVVRHGRSLWHGLAYYRHMDGDRWSSGDAYDSFIGRWSRLVAPVFLDWLAIPAGRRWLDLGCGTGALTAAILDRCAPVSVVGVDPSEPFVAHARTAVADPRAMFAVGNAAATGLADGAVDVAAAALVLNFIPDLGGALAEARRVVSPGGTVAGYVWDYAEGMQLLRRYWDAAVAVDPTARSHDEAVRFPITGPEPLAAAFTAAGLEDVAVRPIDVPTVFSDFDDLWRPFVSSGTGPAPAYAMSLSEPVRAALRERLRASITEEPDGSIRLVARAWAVRGRRGA